MATLVREDAAAARSMMLHFSFLIRQSFGFMLKHLFHMAGEKKKTTLISIGEDKRVFWIESSGPT